MSEEKKILPSWILIVSGIFAVLEILVSLQLYCSPKSVVETIDLGANGVDYLVSMWATRQFALGFIFGFAVLKRSVPMLTLAYVFFLVMMLGDLFIGISQNESALIIGALIMLSVSISMLFAINKRRVH